MNLRKLLPKTDISKEIIEDLAPVFEGERLSKKRHYLEAAEKYQQALDNFPVGSSGRFMIYNKLGIVFEKLSQPHRSIEIYEQCVAEGSITPFTYQRLASLHMDTGAHTKAVDYCNKGLKCLKMAKTDFFQEIYFQFSLRKLRGKAKRM